MTTAPPSLARKEDDLLTRLTLLIGQSFFFGLMLGLLIVAAIALLLSIYGAGALPYVYIVVAILGSLAFYGFAEVQRRWTLIQVSIATELIVVAFLVLAWAGLVFAQASWLAFASMVSFSLIIQVGFVILGGQAGRLLDVRQIKRYFPRIVAGFVIGFMVAGAIVTPIQRWLGGTEYLLLAAAISALVMLFMLLVTNGRYRQILAQTNGGGQQVKSPPLRKVLAKRFVLLIVAYQMLSAMASQLLDFIVMASAGERFADGDALASFFGNYTFFLNLIDLLFLALVAGFLLSRFGLRFGLTANPGVDILLLIGIVAAGVIAGPTAAMFFWLAVIARILDITFTDGTTRTSINAAYQALPAHERVSVQTGVEGIGVPLALGLTGVFLLLFDALGGVTLVHVAAFTLGVSLLWLASALLVYRGYGANLVKTMRRRALDPIELTLDDKASLEVTRQLITSSKLSDVRLALDMLQGADHPSLSEHLLFLVQSDTADIRIEAFSRIENLKLQGALPLVQDASGSSSDPAVQGAAVRALCALQEADAVERVVPYLESSEVDVRLGAVVGLLRYGSIPGVLAVGQRLELWEHSNDTADRCFLAQVTGEVALPYVYQPLISLLADPDADVRRAALAAAGQVKHMRLLPLVVSNLSDRATRTASAEALVAYDDLILPIVERALSGGAVPEEDTVRLVRVCRQVKGEQVLYLMRRHLNHPSDMVRDQVLTALTACDFQAQASDLAALDKALLRDVEHGHRTLIARQDVGEGDGTGPLQQALLDELVEVNRRVFRLLSFLYEAQPIKRAESQLLQGSGAEQALALEMLDVTLSSAHHTLTFPLIDPKLGQAQRIDLLNKQIDTPSIGRDERLQDLIENSAQAWVRACALYAAVRLGVEEMIPIVETRLTDRDPVVRETAEWGLYTLAPERFNQHADTLLADEDRHVASLAAKLVEA
jgi:HEAT repeat protein